MFYFIDNKFGKFVSKIGSSCGDQNNKDNNDTISFSRLYKRVPAPTAETFDRKQAYGQNPNNYNQMLHPNQKFNIKNYYKSNSAPIHEDKNISLG